MSEQAIDRVVIAGSDEGVWLSALALHKGFARAGVAVEVIELPTLLQPSDVRPTLPHIRNFHRLLGLDPAELVRHCGASFAVGQRFVGFGPQPFLHVYASAGASIGGLPFLQAWLKARAEGLTVAYEDFAAGAGLVRSGRFAPPQDAQAAEAYDYGYHLHAAAYAGWLKAHAVHRGVTFRSVPELTPEVQDGQIKALILPDGHRVEADLFVDATGAAAQLITALGGEDFEDWAAWLPLNRLMVAAGKGLSPLPLHAQVTAHAQGWVGLYPHQGQTGMVMAYDGMAYDGMACDGSGLSDEDALKQLVALTGLTPVSGATVSALRSGQRRRSWVGNCVAIGESACALDPIDASGLHIIQIGLTHLLSLFPVARDLMPERDLFNADVASHYQRLRNVSILHYALNQRHGEALWDRVRQAEVPEELAYKLRLFGDRGLLAHMDHESFTEESWHMLLLGHGLIPRTYDYRAEAIFPDPQRAMQGFQNLLGAVRARAMSLPTHEQTLAQMASGQGFADRGVADRGIGGRTAPEGGRRDGWLRPEQAEGWG